MEMCFCLVRFTLPDVAIKVAIKDPKSILPEASILWYLMEEMKKEDMSSKQEPRGYNYIVQMLGMSRKIEPEQYMLHMRVCTSGNLETYLRNESNRAQITEEIMLVWAYQVK